MLADFGVAEHLEDDTAKEKHIAGFGHTKLSERCMPRLSEYQVQ